MVILTKTINLSFSGYWREEHKGSIPNESGIYGVYTCNYIPPKEDKKRSVTLKKLIYIGEAKEVRDRISEHEKWDEWRKELAEKEQICFTFAPENKSNREQSECALIFYHKPNCNEKCKDSFPYEETTVTSTGKHKFIKSPITVKKTEQ